MPAPYRLFYVLTYATQPGKLGEAVSWYEQGLGVWTRMPGVISVQGLTQQFNLGPDEYHIEIWFEIEDYSVLDAWDRVGGELQSDFIELVKAAQSCVKPGPARLMGELAGSVPEKMGGTLAPGGAE